MTVLPTVESPRVASSVASYHPGALVGIEALYTPACSPSHDMGIAAVEPSGPVTCAMTEASFNSTKDLSTTFTAIVAASPGSTRSVMVFGST